jgi:hypothetical protein
MTDLNAMWEALEKYQQFADADGHGESWRVMCEKQTEKAAWVARARAYAVACSVVAWSVVDAADAADSAAWAVADAAAAAYWSARAIEQVEQAIKQRTS